MKATSQTESVLPSSLGPATSSYSWIDDFAYSANAMRQSVVSLICVESSTTEPRSRCLAFSISSKPRVSGLEFSLLILADVFLSWGTYAVCRKPPYLTNVLRELITYSSRVCLRSCHSTSLCRLRLGPRVVVDRRHDLKRHFVAMTRPPRCLLILWSFLYFGCRA